MSFEGTHSGIYRVAKANQLGNISILGLLLAATKDFHFSFLCSRNLGYCHLSMFLKRFIWFGVLLTKIHGLEATFDVLQSARINLLPKGNPRGSTALLTSSALVVAQVLGQFPFFNEMRHIATQELKITFSQQKETIHNRYWFTL